MEESGPTFTKLGQWASSRTDLFPPYVCDLLAKLQSNVRPHSMQQTRRVIEKEYGRTLEEIFEWFEDVPIGVGAIAQVHRARLRKQTIDQLPEEPPSMECAVKVLHPNVVPLVTTDLRIMSSVAHLLSLLPDAEWLSLPDEVRMFGAMMYEQLDLTHEARNLDLFNRNFSDVSDVAFPKAVKGLERKSVLVEEYLWAIPLGKVLDVVDGTGGFEKEVGRIGLDSFLHMLIIDNFVHADLHPGNLFLTFTKPLPDHQSTFSRVSDWFNAVFTDTPKPVGPSLSPTTLTDLANLPPKELQAQLHQLFATNHSPRLIFLDAGLVSVLSSQNLRNFLDLFEAVALFQGRKVARLMMTRSRFPHTVINPEGFEHDMEVFLDEVKQSTLKLGTLSVADILGRVFNMVRKHHIKIEGDFANVGISIALLEGVGRRLDPDTDLLKAALPVLRKAAKMRAKLGVEEDVSFAVYGQGWRYWAGVIYTTARPWLKPILDSLLEMERRAGGFDAWVVYYPDV
ncbi:hypothetical protein HDU85_003922 [Gaertneriomyces sp. JEL0708]|nr:hypothetical protein HDU85_003922 [Gaertneriomyces sp. JEL0708]